ncbi:hypothetical protein [Paenibacillus sp. CAA11]|uniref:hypothetical protein n=1 Tax=Paenibacillus sp. CAA11 TaxID=1532905 RepID=UPI0019018630|nr:hypothetical protein [Paenibacillus sp. CAA11]
MAYTRGNLAVKERATERVHGAPKYRETTKVVTRRSGLPAKEKLLYLMTLAFIIVVGGAIIWRNAHLYDLKMQIHKAESKIKEANLEYSELSVRKQNLLEAIPEEARKLGYVTPEHDGIMIQSNSSSAGVEDVPASAKK